MEGLRTGTCVGYCKSCNIALAEFDKEGDKGKYRCPGCKKLVIPVDQRPTSPFRTPVKSRVWV